MDMVIQPMECKLFSNDTFTIGPDNKITLLHSTIRSGPPIPGVLMLAGNKTYGKTKTQTNKPGKLLYKCTPDDIRLPTFLIPYEIKRMDFSKVFKNLYVTFVFDHWDDKHPRAKLDNVIGPVDVVDNFYEYQLYCKSLNASIQKFHKDSVKALESKTHEGLIEAIKLKYPEIQDRTDQTKWRIITIDPPKSADYDDGFSLQSDDIGSSTPYKILSIYISNVTIWMDFLQLWNSFSRRISTIYLPDKKRPMLPTTLSDCLCSLQENVIRIAFVMDIYIHEATNEIVDMKYSNCFIKVTKNYCYEDAKLLGDPQYHSIFNAVQSLSTKYKYINNVRNSNEMVCYLMILMNYHCAKKLLTFHTGIFRSTIVKEGGTVEIGTSSLIPENVAKFIKIWNSASGQYINGAEIDETRHETLDMDAYIHITSPIRRLVDLLNIIQFQRIMGLVTLTEQADEFYKKWLGDIEYINVTMRAIRKVQCDCALLDLCQSTPEIMDKIYDGYLFDKINRNDGLQQYIVYLPELKLSSRITMRDNFDNYTQHKFKMFLFHDEEKFKRKIRLQMMI